MEMNDPGRERGIARIALLAGLVAALGVLPPIALPFGVPITAQTMGVMLAGAILGARGGFLALLLFLALVAMGLPLLAGGHGGLAVLAGPTAWFLVGWPFGALVTGALVRRLRLRRTALRVALASVIGGIAVIYAFGIVGMSLSLGRPVAECALLVMAFVPGDLVKAAVTGLVVATLERARPGTLPALRGR